MKQLRFSSLLLLFFAFFLMPSCSQDDGDDDNCPPPAFDVNIVGTWSGVTKFNGVIVEGPETVIFNQDGTYDDNDLIISGTANGMVLDEKTYSASGSSMEVRASSGSNFVAATLLLAENQCDFISLELEGFNVFIELFR